MNDTGPDWFGSSFALPRLTDLSEGSVDIMNDTGPDWFGSSFALPRLTDLSEVGFGFTHTPMPASGRCCSKRI
jgi:hypothetical protein